MFKIGEKYRVVSNKSSYGFQKAHFFDIGSTVVYLGDWDFVDLEDELFIQTLNPEHVVPLENEDEEDLYV